MHVIEAPTLAAERDEAVVSAGIAMDSEEAVSEHATLEVGADLALDEAGDRGAGRAGAHNERHELSANHFVKERLLGLVTGVVGDGRASAGTSATGATRVTTSLMWSWASGDS